jgi:hypothetical protein
VSDMERGPWKSDVEARRGAPLMRGPHEMSQSSKQVARSDRGVSLEGGREV